MDHRLSDVPIAKEHVKQLVKDLLLLVETLCEAAKSQRKYANHQTMVQEYAVGDSVWLSEKNLRTARPSHKLDHQYHDSFKVIDRIGSQTYRLRLKNTIGKTHDAFYMSLLEPYKLDMRGAPAPPPPD